MMLLAHAIEQAWLAQLCRESYIAVLDSHLQKRGTKKDFAQALGITQTYLSNLLDPFNPRTPDHGTAQRIAATLSLPPQAQRELVEMMMLAKGRAQATGLPIAAAPVRPLDAATVAGLIQQMSATYAAAHAAAQPTAAASGATWLLIVGRHMLASVNPRDYPVSWAMVAMMMVDVALPRNRQLAAMLWIKRAGAILQAVKPTARDPHQALYPQLLTETLRQEAVTLNHLALCEEAGRVLDRAAWSEDARRRPGYWLPHLLRDRLRALCGIRRASVHEAIAVAARGVDACREYPEPSLRPLLEMLMQRGLANFQLRRGHVKEAAMLLAPYGEGAPLPAGMGPLHRMMLLASQAEMWWLLGARTRWRAVMVEALAVGSAARLTHPCDRLRRRYAGALTEVLAEVDEETLARLATDDAGGA